MTGELYDHLIAVIVVSVLFLAAVVAVPNMSYVNLLYMDQQQLRNIALNTLKTMLLDAGYPANWGLTSNFDPDQVERFGLALASSSSFYVLDPNKVQRLVVGNPAGFIEYEDIRTKLKIEGYGFNFRIVPPFKVIVNGEDFGDDDNPISLQDLVEGVEVLVTYNDGSPIPKASVEATLVYVFENDKDSFYTVKARNNTDAVGKCIIKPDITGDPNDISDFIIVFKATVADMTTVTSSYMEGFNQQHVMNASIVGENITLRIPEGPGWEKDSAGTRWVDNVIIVSEDGVWSIYNGTRSNEDKITWGGGNWGWSRLFSGLSSYNPLFIIFNLSVPNPRRLVLFLGPEPNWTGSRVEAYGDPTGAGGASSAVRVQRNVIISGMTYIAELTLWKE